MGIGRAEVEELEAITRNRKKAHGKLLHLKFKVYEGFLQLEEAAFADGTLSRKMKGSPSAVST
jgi:hypothetical protein